MNLRLVVQRRVGAKMIDFEFCTNPMQFDKSMWARVVGIICSGNMHEFRDLPDSTNKLLFFRKCK